MNIFETLNKLNETGKRKPAYIYLDEMDNKIKEIPLSKLDSAGSALINRTIYKNPARLIHEFMFGKY